MSENRMDIVYHFTTAMQKKAMAQYDALQAERTLAFKYGKKSEVAALDREIDIAFAAIDAYGVIIDKLNAVTDAKVGA